MSDADARTRQVSEGGEETIGPQLEWAVVAVGSAQEEKKKGRGKPGCCGPVGLKEKGRREGGLGWVLAQAKLSFSSSFFFEFKPWFKFK